MKLYWAPRTRSLRALWVLEEAGVPYERVRLDLSVGEQRARRFARRRSPLSLTGRSPSLNLARSAPMWQKRILRQASRRRSAIRRADAICNGCFSRRAVSSPPI
jgi:hypothetical protein